MLNQLYMYFESDRKNALDLLRCFDPYKEYLSAVSLSKHFDLRSKYNLSQIHMQLLFYAVLQVYFEFKTL